MKEAPGLPETSSVRGRGPTPTAQEFMSLLLNEIPLIY